MCSCARGSEDIQSWELITEMGGKTPPPTSTDHDDDDSDDGDELGKGSKNQVTQKCKKISFCILAAPKWRFGQFSAIYWVIATHSAKRTFDEENELQITTMTLLPISISPKPPQSSHQVCSEQTFSDQHYRQARDPYHQSKISYPSLVMCNFALWTHGRALHFHKFPPHYSMSFYNNFLE